MIPLLLAALALSTGDSLPVSSPSLLGMPAGRPAPIEAAGEGLPVRSPSAVGMSAARLASIDRVIRRGISAGGYPGAAVVVGRKGFAVWQKGFGRLDWTHPAEVSPGETVYDLASLTKVVGTTTAVMILYDEGRIQLDAPVNAYLPEFTGGWKDSVTVRQLLTHRSGLSASRNIWRMAHTPAEARFQILTTPLACRPAACFIYSDIGAATLGIIVEQVSGIGLDEFLEARVFAPLGMKETGFRPDPSLRDRIAPTEVLPPRGYPLRGEVHDENAYAMGGVSGHAGLFSTAADISIFAQLMLNGGEYNGTRIISDSTVRLFTQRAVGNRALGWASADGSGGSGRYLSNRAYGHTGFTGTSLWIDPDRDMFVLLLTNRVHVARARRPAKVISDVRADLADAAAIAVMDSPEGVLAMPAAFRADRAVGWNGVERSSKARRSKASRSRRSSKSAKARKPVSGSSSKVRTARASKGSKAVAKTRSSATRKTVSKVARPSVKKSTTKSARPTPARKPAPRKSGAKRAQS
ncbi:MAG: serine hydrolase [Gemmatimonadota bacterium]|nr:serine hydrolase [Gemmatimonadota bacterium]